MIWSTISRRGTKAAA